MRRRLSYFQVRIGNQPQESSHQYCPAAQPRGVQAVKSMGRAGSKAASCMQGQTRQHHHTYWHMPICIRTTLSHSSERKQVTFSIHLDRWSSAMWTELILCREHGLNFPDGYHGVSLAQIRKVGEFSLHPQLTTTLQLDTPWRSATKESSATDLLPKTVVRPIKPSAQIAVTSGIGQSHVFFSSQWKKSRCF